MNTWRGSALDHNIRQPRRGCCTSSTPSAIPGSCRTHWRTSYTRHPGRTDRPSRGCDRSRSGAEPCHTSHRLSWRSSWCASWVCWPPACRSPRFTVKWGRCSGGRNQIPAPWPARRACHRSRAAGHIRPCRTGWAPGSRRRFIGRYSRIRIPVRGACDRRSGNRWTRRIEAWSAWRHSPAI